MQIANEFSLGLPLEQAWPLLTDLERVAPAMPGVTVEGVDGDDLRATMRVKVGPITVSYRTTVTLASVDEASHTAVLRARGRELRGRGTVEASVTASLRAADAASTVVALTTDLAVTGRVAQFGGGVMSEVADRLLRQFAVKLVAELEEPAPAGPTTDAAYAGTAAAPAAGAGESASEGPTTTEAYAAPSAAGVGSTTASSGSGAGAAGSGGAGAPSGPSVDAAYAPAAGANGHAPGATRAPKEAEPVDLGNIAGAALLPSGPAVGAFLGALLGTFLGAFLAELLLRARR